MSLNECETLCTFEFASSSDGLVWNSSWSCSLWILCNCSAVEFTFMHLISSSKPHDLLLELQQWPVSSSTVSEELDWSCEGLTCLTLKIFRHDWMWCCTFKKWTCVWVLRGRFAVNHEFLIKHHVTSEDLNIDLMSHIMKCCYDPLMALKVSKWWQNFMHLNYSIFEMHVHELIVNNSIVFFS